VSSFYAPSILTLQRKPSARIQPETFSPLTRARIPLSFPGKGSRRSLNVFLFFPEDDRRPLPGPIDNTVMRLFAVPEAPRGTPAHKSSCLNFLKFPACLSSLLVTAEGLPSCTVVQ
jgi:hypothetical protein